MAIEDIIWAKNRHMFGGIAPSNMRQFSANVDASDKTKVRITAQAPLKTTVDGQTVCTIAGVVIRKKADEYPINEFDGSPVTDEYDNSVFTGTSRFTVTDTIKENQSMYYAAFPFSKQGVYNRSSKNRAVVKPESHPSVATYIFGYDLNTANSDPDTRVTYPDDVDNYNWAPVTLNNLGSDWGSIQPGKKFMPQPCMLKYDCTVDYFLNPDNYTLKLDGSSSDIANALYEGNAMMQWPKIYTKRWEEDGVYHFRCSDVKVDKDYECWCNYDANNNEIDYFYTAIYRSVSDSARHKSVSGKEATTGDSFEKARTMSKANGNGWDVEVISDHLLIQDLLVMMGKSTDTQTVFGMGGFTKDNLKTNGSTNAKGLFYGDTDGSSMIKVFGMEDYWGVLGRRMLGLMYKNKTLYVKVTAGTKDGSTIADYSYDENALTSFAEKQTNPSDSEYITKMTTYPWGRLPSAFSGGSASTYECDHYYSPNDATAAYVFSFGQRASSSQYYAGAFQYTFQYLYDSYSSKICSRLSCKPTKS